MLPDILFEMLMPPIEGLDEVTHEEGDRTIQVSLLSSDDFKPLMMH